MIATKFLLRSSSVRPNDLGTNENVFEIPSCADSNGNFATDDIEAIAP